MYQMDKQYEYTLKHRECHYSVITYILLLVAKSCPILCNHVDCKDCQAPLSMGFPRQECWSGLPFPPPGYISDLGISCLAGRFLTTEPPGKPIITYNEVYFAKNTESLCCTSETNTVYQLYFNKIFFKFKSTLRFIFQCQTVRISFPHRGCI